MKLSPVATYILVELVMLASAVTSCSPSPGAPTRAMQTGLEQDPAFIATTPEEAARQHIAQSPEPGVAASFRIWGRRDWWGGVVVLYTAFRGANEHAPAMPLRGAVIVERAPGGWFARSSGGGRLSTSPEDLVDFGIGGGTSAMGHYNILDGQVLSAEVAAVEAIFDDGQTRRDEADNQVFAFVTPEHTIACELRVLDANDQVLRNFDLPSLFPGMPPNKCATRK